jgi:signal transduction histidine kinase
MFYVAITVFGALFIMVSVQYLALKPILERTREQNIASSIENMSPLIAHSLWLFDDSSLTEATHSILRDQFITGISINDHKGLFSLKLGDLSGQKSLNPMIEDKQNVSTSSSLKYQFPLIVDNAQGIPTNIGTMLITADNSQLSQQIRELVEVSLGVSVLVIILLQAIVSWMTKTIIAKPLEQITEHVQKQMQNLDSNLVEHSFSLKNRPDEIGRLYREFNNQHQVLIERDQDLAKYRTNLEQLVEHRTHELSITNKELAASLNQLQIAQKELIQQEKMASLGALVSGIAHEVNTPLGIAITATSHLSQEIKDTHAQFIQGNLTKSEFERFFDTCLETEVLLTNNLKRAGKLIQSFKKVAVDQASDHEREFNLYTYSDEIITSLSPRLRKSKVTVKNNLAHDIELYSFAGAYSQVLTNLISNSLIHGFDNGTLEGEITLDAEDHDTYCTIIYQDNGRGMSKETLKRVYDPFYTTNRAEGGSGLGMNIVYNLITSKLNGTIETTSLIDQGVKVTMTLKKQQHDTRESDHE